MRALAELTGTRLKWQPRGDFKLDYELIAGEEPAAALRFRSTSGSLATAESADGCWTFKRVGIWQVRVTVRRCGSDLDVGSFRYEGSAGEGTLRYSGDRRYLVHTTAWGSSIDFRTEDGQPLIRLNSEGMMRHAALMEIVPAQGPVLGDLPVMAMLAWYLIVLTYIDAGAVATG